MGLLDMIERPEGVGLLSAVASYAANARRGTPWNNIGRGLLGGVAGYELAQERQKQEADNAVTRKYKQTLLDKTQMEMDTAKQTQDWRAGLSSMLKPKLTGNTDQGKQLAEQNAAFGEAGIPDLVSSAQYAGQGAPLGLGYGVDQSALQDYILKPGSPVADKLLEQTLVPKKEEFGTTPFVDTRGNAYLIGKGGTMKATGLQGENKDKSNIAQLLAEMANLPPGDPRRNVYQDAIKKATTHQPGINVAYGAPVAGVDSQGNPVFFQPNKTGGTPSIIPGVRPNDQGQTPENAGKIAMAQQAVKDLDSAEALLFGQNGRLMNNVVWGMNVPGFAGMPGNTPARNAYSAIQNAVAAKLRLETGAAANQSEVENIARRFMPTPADTSDSARNKLSRLRDFFNTSLSQTKGVKQQPGKKAAAQMSNDELLKALGE